MSDTKPNEDCAAVWFAILERAKNRNDFELAAKAERELRRLGVDVRFVPDSDREKTLSQTNGGAK